MFLGVGALVLAQAACTTPRRVHAPEPIVPKGQPFVEKTYNDLATIDSSTQVFPVSPRILLIPDSDHDGVNDEADKCPGTIEKTRVDTVGCPVDADSDKDGVKDSADKCPGTPTNTKVDGNGCAYPAANPAPAAGASNTKQSDGGSWNKNQSGANTGGGGSQPVTVTVNNYINGVKVNDQEPLVKTVKTVEPQPVTPATEDKDSDQDGVKDRLDKCPGTAAGVRVDAAGCPVLLEDVAIDLNVLFATDKAVIIDNAYVDILKVADFMRKYPTVEMIVEGHTDSRASIIHNQKLSARRAQAVRRELLRFGVDGSRLRAVGYGELRPVADNDTEEGRAKNRRVVATAKAQISK